MRHWSFGGMRHWERKSFRNVSVRTALLQGCPEIPQLLFY